MIQQAYAAHSYRCTVSTKPGAARRRCASAEAMELITARWCMALRPSAGLSANGRGIGLADQPLRLLNARLAHDLPAEVVRDFALPDATATDRLVH